MSESFSQGCPAKSGEKSWCRLLLYSSGRIICLNVSTFCAQSPPSRKYNRRRGGLSFLAGVLASQELHDRGLRGRSTEGPAPAPIARKACLRGELGDRRRRLQQASSSPSSAGASRAAREAVFVQSVGTPLSRKQRRTMYTGTLIWVQDNPKARVQGRAAKSMAGQDQRRACLEALI